MKVVYNGDKPKGLSTTQLLIIPIVIVTIIATIIVVYLVATKNDRIANIERRNYEIINETETSINKNSDVEVEVEK